jgi:hypothetical protein
VNKVYFFREKSGEFGGVYVAAETWKKARNIAITEELISEYADNVITDIEGHLCRNNNKKPIITEIEGILNVQQICDLGLAWWDCEECGDDDFEILNYESEFKCRKCGFIDDIPYVNS